MTTTTCPPCADGEHADDGTGQPCPCCGQPCPPQEPPHPHYVKTNMAWTGSGRDGDPWVLVSWDTEPCTCNRPWRHQRLA